MPTRQPSFRHPKFHHVNESLVALFRAFHNRLLLDDGQGAITHLGFHFHSVGF